MDDIFRTKIMDGSKWGDEVELIVLFVQRQYQERNF
jgi:hypothetical protein